MLRVFETFLPAPLRDFAYLCSKINELA